MITLEISWLAFFYVASGIAIIIGLWVYYDFRDFNSYEALRSRVSFHCIRCGKIYVDNAKKKEAKCPQCGAQNGPLRF